ncbi:MAG: thermonuclease family protein [Nitrosopumilus sp.]|nr:thermonuclease family protein [Nitrosopumilus sp.]MDH3822267.1 thermonuclease family protein [Nitrosopumilus sp.]MDH3833068.1 thermonuclease family protein [Nitrosopumilus sp.]
MRKDLITITGVGVPVLIIMIAIGGGGHSPSIDFEEDTPIIEEPKQTESTYQVTPKPTPPQDIISSSPQLSIQSSYSLQDCSGIARCIIGKVTQVIDGDTIKADSQSIRFALASAPELDESGGIESKELIETLCPIGSTVLVDEDDGQTQGSHGRILAVIYCNDVNLNEELLDSGLGYLASEFCDDSEFVSTKWAKKHGCQYSEPQRIEVDSNCDPSYPDFCISSPPPDLDCKDIPQKRFTVLQPDPHRFDGDKDGIGCES